MDERTNTKTRQAMKQTSIDWLIDQLQAPCRGIPSHIIEQAKEMHKEEILEAWNGGINCTEENGKSYDQYYNETFKQDKQ